MLDGFGEGAGGGGVGGFGRVDLGEDVRGEEGEAEAVVGGGEGGEGFGEDVRCSFVAGEMGVELVAV